MTAAGPTTGENDLVPIRLSTSSAPPDARWRLTYPTGKVKVWGSADRSNPVASGAEQQLPIPATLYVEGIQVSTSSGDIVIELVVLQGAGGQPLCSDSVKAMVIKGNLEVFRPNTTPFVSVAVPDATELTSPNPSVIPGAGVRFNGDDDNANGTPDHTEAPVSNENDLVRLSIDGEPFFLPAGYEWVIGRSNAAVQLWRTPTKAQAEVFGGQAVGVVELQDWFIEWVDPAINQATLEFGVRRQGTSAVTVLDAIALYRFRSIVIALGGEGQVPADPTIPNHGTFQVAIGLYGDGYDVHMYDEDVVNDVGAGAAYDEVVSAIEARDIRKIAVFGYSHGGGSTYCLCNRLAAPPIAIQGTFAVVFTSYVDAVENDSGEDVDQELRYPPGSGYHLNQYQHGGLGDIGLDGGPIAGSNPAPSGLDVETTAWGAAATHYVIDDFIQARNAITSALKAVVAP